MSTLPAWNEERVQKLLGIIGTAKPVTAVLVTTAATELDTTTRSIASKLRKMGLDVVSMAKDTSKKYTEAEEAEITKFLTANDGKFTYSELVGKVLKNNPRTPKQLQGKILSMELTKHVKASPVAEVVKKYSDAEEAKLVKLLAKGGYIEDIAKEMGKEVNSIRGKVLSMLRADPSIKIPEQKNVISRSTEDPIAALGDISGISVAEIAEKIKKSERGVKSMLTHRALTCKDYDGAKRAEKLSAKKVA